MPKSRKTTTKRGGGRIKPKKVTIDVNALIPRVRFNPKMYSGGAVYRGGNIWDDMKRGFENFGNQTQQAFQKVGNEFTNPNSVLNQGLNKVGNEFTDDKSELRKAFYQDGFIRNGLIDGLGQAAAVSAFIPGIGEVLAPALGSVAGAAKGLDQAARMVGVGMTGRGRARKYFKVPVDLVQPKLYLDSTVPYSKAYRKMHGLPILRKRKAKTVAKKRISKK